MSTIRQLLVESLLGALGQIRIGGGFATDAGLRVMHFRDLTGEPFQDGELECLVVRDVQELATAISASVHEFALSIEIQGLAAAGQYTAERIYSLRGDILQAIAGDPTMGGNAFYCVPTSTELDVERLGKRTGVAKVMLEARYRTPPWNPTTLWLPPS